MEPWLRMRRSRRGRKDARRRINGYPGSSCKKVTSGAGLVDFKGQGSRSAARILGMKTKKLTPSLNLVM